MIRIPNGETIEQAAAMLGSGASDAHKAELIERAIAELETANVGGGPEFERGFIIALLAFRIMASEMPE